ncbi:DUF1801 domain-containing protein [Mesorhizobium sp. CN2-181]|uniref:iron chaperone n=1 Tax=Mesorhizobium yinganensis TaxID=3157707 RepID=UPI0032B76FD0
MAKTDYKSVDEYIAAQPEASQAVLKKVRESIRKVLPEAEEVISYQIPAFKTKAGRPIYFSGWKKHYSLYPATGPLTAAFTSELAAYEVEKGTIRFPLSAPVPEDLIGRIAQFRANEVEEEAKAKAAAAAKKKR